MTWLCERFAVTPGGFYAWRQRGVSARAKQDRVLTTESMSHCMERHVREKRIERDTRQLIVNDELAGDR